MRALLTEFRGGLTGLLPLKGPDGCRPGAGPGSDCSASSQHLALSPQPTGLTKRGAEAFWFHIGQLFGLWANTDFSVCHLLPQFKTSRVTRGKIAVFSHLTACQAVQCRLFTRRPLSLPGAPGDGRTGANGPGSLPGPNTSPSWGLGEASYPQGALGNNGAHLAGRRVE